MFQNHFKTAWRNLVRNKAFAITNAVSLTIGITCALLILIWVQHERTYDQFHANYRNVYQVIAHRNFNNTIFTDRSMVWPLAEEIEKNVPQVKKAVVTTYQGESVLTYGDKKIKQSGYEVGDGFFEIFTWKFIKGNAATALREPNSIVLTQSAARTFFGDDDPVGKMLKKDNDVNAKVVAIVEDVPNNSSFQFDWIAPFNLNAEDIQSARNEWQNSSWTVFIQTEPNVDLNQLNSNITQVKRAHGKDEISTYFAFPMAKWHLYSNFSNGVNTGGIIDYVRLFSIIAVIILLVACINFMNLSTARSEKRAKEVGIRKTLGSSSKQLTMQFFCESMLLTLVAFVISVGAVALVLPYFNVLVDRQMSLDFTQPFFWLSALATVLFTGVVAGSYPALYLSSFKPIKVLKGAFSTGKNAVLPRHVLVVAQFIISIVLISATIIVYQQIQHVKDRDMGYNPNNLLMIPSTPDLEKNFDVIKQELAGKGVMKTMSRTSSPITELWWSLGSPDYEGKPANSSVILGGLRTDAAFTETMNIKMLQGRYFSGTPADSLSLVLNNAAITAMGLKNPVGMEMRLFGKRYTLIGIMDNVVMTSPFESPNPMLYLYHATRAAMINIRLQDGVSPQKALLAIEASFTRHNPSVPFEFRFVDSAFQEKFLEQELIGKLTNIFAGLAIFICCLGLAGLVSFTIEKRLREIGVRKVLGASVQQVLLLISKDFLRLVGIALLIAIPLTWWVMQTWLNSYSELVRIHISPWLFAAVGLGMLLLTLVVVSTNTLKAAVTNPSKTLRTE